MEAIIQHRECKFIAEDIDTVDPAMDVNFAAAGSWHDQRGEAGIVAKIDPCISGFELATRCHCLLSGDHLLECPFDPAEQIFVAGVAEHHFTPEATGDLLSV